MPDPFLFDTTSPRFGLPLLFAGQAQKEAHVNEAHSLADGLIHCAIEGTQASPPATPANGAAWIVGASPTGDWADHEGAIALRQADNWLFVQPIDGLRVLDRSTGQDSRYFSGWQTPPAPAEPSGGSVVDAEARSAISDLIVALRASGVFSAS